jgi:hypothetical protein
MNNLDFLTKEQHRTFVYSTISNDRLSSKSVCINGRWYEKYGVEQAVCFFGVIYKVMNNVTGCREYILHVGMSKQHPDDSRINKSLAIELSQENALIDPIIEMKVSDKFEYYDFKCMMEIYVNTLNLKFIKTRQEKELEKHSK